MKTAYAQIDLLLKELRAQTMRARQTSLGVKAIEPSLTKQSLQERDQIMERAWSAIMEICSQRGLEMPDAIPHDTSTVKKKAKGMLYGLARQGDARRKYGAYSKDQQEISEQEIKIDAFSKILRLRQNIDNQLQKDGRKQSISQIAEHGFAEDLHRLAVELGESGLVVRPENMPEDIFIANIRTYILTQLEVPADIMRVQLSEKQKKLADRKQAWVEVLSDARHADLAEYIRDEQVRELMRLYHIEGKRFIPVGGIKQELDELDQIVTGSNGPILRAFLYGPPGTGKTESLREIGNLHEQRVRVISLHETSTFETLVGMHQIPLPKAETVADAENFWMSIKNLSPRILSSMHHPQTHSKLR